MNLRDSKTHNIQKFFVFVFLTMFYSNNSLDKIKNIKLSSGQKKAIYSLLATSALGIGYGITRSSMKKTLENMRETATKDQFEKYRSSIWRKPFLIGSKDVYDLNVSMDPKIQDIFKKKLTLPVKTQDSNPIKDHMVNVAAAVNAENIGWPLTLN